MSKTFKIHPALGIARLGNSTTSFYLEPDTAGGLPLECDENGNENGKRVQQFKDEQGRIKRQGSKFRVFRYDDNNPEGEELTLDSPDVESMEWTVHVANKKAAFWEFTPLIGNTQINIDNTYETGSKTNPPLVVKRNSAITEDSLRQLLIIDPGPRRLSGKNQATDFSASTAPIDYPFTSFPDNTTITTGYPVTTLGSMCTDANGRLVVIGGYGNAGGPSPITGYAGADGWYDDTADGQVTCTIKFTSGHTEVLDAWVLSASPRFAPELVPITTVADDMLDTAVRYMNYMPEIYDEFNGFNRDYIVNFQRDIQPILERPKAYLWVSNTPAMIAFTNPPFDPKDNSAELLEKRRNFLGYWRIPRWTEGGQMNELWDERKMPLMPMNSGSNSVDNYYVEKFLTLTPFQYYCLQQWAEGKFDTEENQGWPGLHTLDLASVGNCNGLPLCPGIETSWNILFPTIYSEPFRIKHSPVNYYKTGLNIQNIETDPDAIGCEPGDLSKRMAVPWQADMYQCSVQSVNWTGPQNQDPNQVPIPPTYFTYWWPIHSPWNIITGSENMQEQQSDAIMAGIQVLYARGINSFDQMVLGWKYLGFLVNQNEAVDKKDYPYIVEKERNNDQFTAISVSAGSISYSVTGNINPFSPMWFLKDKPLTGYPLKNQ